MRNFFDAVWWWIRLAAVLAVAIYLISLIALNAGEQPRLWYWYGRADAPVSIVSLVLVSFLSGGVVFTTGWAMFKAMLRYRRTRAERRERAERDARREIERKAAMLRVKPAPQPIVRKPPAPQASPRTPLLTTSTVDNFQAQTDDPGDAEARAVTIAAPMPVPAATRAAETTPMFDFVEVREDVPVEPLVGEAVATDDAPPTKLPPASPPPAGG